MRFFYGVILTLFIFFNSFAQIKITATIKPLAEIAKAIADSKAKVTYIIPTNVSIHTYEYKLSDIQAVYTSDIFIFIGTGEPDIHSLEKNARKEKINVSKIKGLHKITEFEFKEEHEHHKHLGENIHPALWLDPYNGIKIGEVIYKKLSEIDPDNRDFYKKNFESFKKDVEKIYKEGKEKISSLKNRYFISYHYAWPYFTKAFNLIYLDVIELGHGREPTPKHLIEVIRKIKKFNIKNIFAAKQFYNKRYGEFIKRNAGVNIVFLDPFGENLSYTEMLKFNIDKVYKALKR